MDIEWIARRKIGRKQQGYSEQVITPGAEMKLIFERVDFLNWFMECDVFSP